MLPLSLELIRPSSPRRCPSAKGTKITGKLKKIYSLPPSLKLTNDMVNLLRKEEKVVKAEAKALNAKEFFGWRLEVLDFSLEIVFLLNINNKYLYMYLR